MNIRIRAAPSEEKANEALIKFLAILLEIKKDNIQIAYGKTQEIRLFSLKGLVSRRSMTGLLNI